MARFKLLHYLNRIVYEDDEIAVKGFCGDVTGAGSRGTVFFFVSYGHMTVDGYPVYTGMYGTAPAQDFKCISREGCLAMIVVVKHYKGIFQLSGSVETKGRLRYIDGCSSTMLVSPFKDGDPSLHYLHFPKFTKQTLHTHPSIRIGTVYDGFGVCRTKQGNIELNPDSMFLIHANELHGFETHENEMKVVTFHPETTLGLTDETHPMLNKTVIA